MTESMAGVYLGMQRSANGPLATAQVAGRVVRTPRVAEKASYAVLGLQRLRASGAVKGRSLKRPVTLCIAEVVAPPTGRQAPSKPFPRRYKCRSREGHSMCAIVEDGNNVRHVRVGVASSAVGDEAVPYLEWGLYRSSASKWYHPKGSIPKGSAVHKPTGAMRTQMHRNLDTDQYEASIDVPSDLLPVTLGCSVFLEGASKYITPRGAAHFGVPVGLQAGLPSPLGIQLAGVQKGFGRETTYAVNFSVVSRHASSVTLCLYRQPEPSEGDSKRGSLEIVLDPTVNRTGDVWHVCLEELRDLNSLSYGWRTTGPLDWDGGARFQPSIVLLDPYAAIAGPIVLPSASASGKIKSAVMGSLAALVMPSFDWGEQPGPRHALENVIACSMDMRHLQAIGESSGSAFKAAQSLIPRLKTLGINAAILDDVLLSEIDSKSENRVPISHFSPDCELAAEESPLQASLELKELVKAMHDNGIEVLLKIQYCFTAEGSDTEASLLSLRGLDASLYYRGSGVLNCGHPITRQLVRDSLRHWVTNYKVDGFCFQNAENMVVDSAGIVQDNPSLPEDLVHDAVLRRCKLVAISSDDGLLPRCGERGFPHWGVWAEWNKRFQADMWDYLVECRDGKLSAVATRVTGSADLFAARWDGGLPGCLASGRRPAFGFNCPAPLLGTLKGALHGRKYPATGAGKASIVQSLMGSLLVASLLCQGVPVLPFEALSDEWLSDLIDAVNRVRTKYRDLLQPSSFDAPRAVQWHGPVAGSEPAWEAHGSFVGGPTSHNFISFSLCSSESRGVYVAFNPHDHPTTTQVPGVVRGCCWQTVVDSSLAAPGGVSSNRKTLLEGGASITMAPKSSIILEIQATPTNTVRQMRPSRSS